jgi:hypothetical protein
LIFDFLTPKSFDLVFALGNQECFLFYSNFQKFLNLDSYSSQDFQIATLKQSHLLKNRQFLFTRFPKSFLKLFCVSQTPFSELLAANHFSYFFDGVQSFRVISLKSKIDWIIL